MWSCKCDAIDSSQIASSSSTSTSTSSAGCCGLTTLAQAAEPLCCSTAPDANRTEERQEDTSSHPKKHPRDCCKPSPKARSKRLHRQSSPETPAAFQRGPVLPPILSASLTESLSSSYPDFPVIPPLSDIASMAGSGCTCGFDCTCPGCVEHRGPDHASKDHGDCPECGDCVDNELGIELPTSTPFGGISSSNTHVPDFLEAFFAKAASIPPPPPERAFARTLDPMNITVYPMALFNGEAKTLGERGPSFGLVQLPKLECCAGRCGCPGDSCACGQNCDGCCSHHEHDSVAAANKVATSVAVEVPLSELPQAVEVRSCCAG